MLIVLLSLNRNGRPICERQRNGAYKDLTTQKTINSNRNLRRAQYIRSIEKGITDEHILVRAKDLTSERLKIAKKRRGFE